MKTLPRPKSFTLERYIVACSAALGSVTSQAAIVHHEFSGANVPLSDTDFLFIDVDGGSFSITNEAPAGYDLNFFTVTQSDGLFQFQAGSGGGALGFTVAPYAYVERLGAGVDVDASLSGAFLTSGILAAGQPPESVAEWNAGVTSGYVGFRFQPASTMLSGWARLSVSSNLLGNPVATVHEVAYETSGAPIETGAVPEPTALALLAVGALGLARWRKSRG